MVGEKCGVCGVRCYDNSEAFNFLYWGLIAQNHRGHESYGFLTHSEGFRRYVDLGLVPRIERGEFLRWGILLPGKVGVAHVRYGTSGNRDVYAHLKDAQPMIVSKGREKLGLGFNGNIVNIGWLKDLIIRSNRRLKTSSDTELLCRFIIDNMQRGVMDAIRNCMENVEGSYSVVGLTSKGELFAFRDPLGMRPLCYGQSRGGGIKAVSSETVGLNINSLDVIDEVQPGEALIMREDGVERERLVKDGRSAFCSFEFAYFARPDSMINGRHVYKIREQFGRNLGKRYRDIVEHCDLIISIPETADDAAYGLHEETGLRWERTLRRHRYVTHRAFILEDSERTTTIDRKINVVDGSLKGKNIIVVEDSIVRGDTTKTIIKKLKEGGAVKVYLFVTFPKISNPCFYGIDMATFSELIGFYFDEAGIAREIGADGVFYQPLADFIEATGMSGKDLCMACVTGNYPTDLAQRIADKVRSTVNKEDHSRIYERHGLGV
jgi:amidophosphoribosyltransferase